MARARDELARRQPDDVSRRILSLLSDHKPAPARLARIAVREWEALGDGIVDSVVALTHDSRYSETCDTSAAWYQKQLKKIEGGLAKAQADIGSNAFCHGNAFSLGDICIGMALGYLDRAYANYDWRSKYPGLKRYADRLFARASFAATMPPKA